MTLHEEIKQLASCEPTDIPFINFFLDTRLVEAGNRNCDVFLETKYDFLHCEFLMNGGDTDSFMKSWKTVKHILNSKLHNETRGLILILRPGPTDEFIFVKQLNVPITNKIIIDGIPQICHILELINHKDISN